MANTWIQDNIDSLDKVPTRTPPRPSPAPRPTTPAPQPSLMQRASNTYSTVRDNPIVQAVTAPQRAMTAGLGKAGEVLSAPGRFVENKLTNNRGYEDFFTNTDTGKKITSIASNKAVQAILPPAAAYSNPKTASLATSLALDPWNLVGMGFVSKAGKMAKLPQIATKIGTTLSKSKAGPLIEKAKDFAGQFQYGYKMAPRTLKKYEQLQGETEKAVQYAKKVASPLFYGKDGKPLDAKTQKIIGDIMSSMAGGKPTMGLTPDDAVLYQKYKPLVEKTFKEFSKLAQEQIRAGADPSIFKELLGKYGGQRMYSSKFAESRLPSRGIGIDISPYQKRQNISEEARKAMGEITEPAFGAAIAAFKEKKNVSLLNFFKDVAKKEAVSSQGYAGLDDVAKANLAFVPKEARYGVLAGSYIPKSTYSYIRPLVEKGAEGFGKVAEDITKVFKAGKTVLSPKQLGRNMLTSQIQAFLENPESLMYLPQAIKDKLTKGKFYQALKKTGEISQTMPSQELASFMPEELSKLSNRNVLQKVFNAVKKPGSAVQSGTEEVSKLQSFMARLYDEAGKARIPIDEALKRRDLVEIARKSAETSQFNYQKVSPIVAKLRRGWIPFITYPTKAAELTAKVLKEHPERYTALMKGERAIQESFEKPVDEQYLPEYLNQAVRVGNPDEKGTTPYVNTKYFYPHGNLQDISPLPFGLGPNPILSEGAQQLLDKDLLTGKKISETGKLRHFIEAFAPSSVRSGWQAYDAATKNPKSATSGTVKDILIKETGLPYYKYNPKQGKSIQQYDRTEKINALRKELRNYIKDYTGKKSSAEIAKKKQEIAKAIREVSSK